MQPNVRPADRLSSYEVSLHKKSSRRMQAYACSPLDGARMPRRLTETFGKLCQQVVPTESMRMRSSQLPHQCRMHQRRLAVHAVAIHNIRTLGGDAEAAMRAFQHETVLESGLHIPSITAGQCFEQYGLPSSALDPLPAPRLSDMPTDRQSQKDVPANMSNLAIRDLGACLAAPFDEEDLRNRLWDEHELAPRALLR